MNMQHNIAAQIESAEAAGDASLLAAICRALLAADKPKPRKPKASAEHDLLTLCERQALGLPPEPRSAFKKDGAYRWVLVEFESGYMQLTGMYPRAKDPESLAPAIASVRGRYLLHLQGGRFYDRATVLEAAERLPKVTGARVVTDCAELESLRIRCLYMRLLLEAFDRPALPSREKEAGPGWCPP